MATAEELRGRAKRRSLTIQSIIVVLTVLVVWGAVSNAQYNLTQMNMTSGFSFLERDTGWDYSFSLIERSISDRYYYTLFIGLLNTLFVGFICIISTTFFGFIIGTLRDARHPALSLAANVYVQIFRNIPLILQAVFLYAVLIHMGGPRQAVNLADVAFLSGRGLMLPGLNISPNVAVGLLLASIAIAVGLIVSKASLWRGLATWFGASVVLCLITTVVLRPVGAPFFSIPALQGLRFQGGISVPIELLALVVSITLYGSAYIAEIVRGGLAQVPRGLVEAGQALGLSRVSIWSRIKVPMALRSIIPPLGNQWIFMMKATTIGIAIGFSDLFYITVNSISQSGQTLELILILMLTFLAINYSIAIFTNWLNARLQLKEH
ncbi:ABC transporter permease subunit [Sulfitobacter donghicola]|uniref:ABC transporter permease n=1 Tax=Sulfitobacter donghicola DSW-25 = KCTC 12864 = JCM 14565 TaxID=1300350 RepID=A0A073IHL9_9RHOB|nr:ABC transporter permease subunit [Sulfitobacter donghicola]KEJ89015.1 ABC transporter permease [Sulfitobacter donghicola DSW-25 = KCTC 12864 = JCM 14565]KIN67424.1 ABC-type amino acid transport system, permease component [Sulfitobacter donghicola DSW-25 = KCTC 12864 = JCM 14565]